MYLKKSRYQGSIREFKTSKQTNDNSKVFKRHKLSCEHSGRAVSNPEVASNLHFILKKTEERQKIHCGYLVMND